MTGLSCPTPFNEDMSAGSFSASPFSDDFCGIVNGDGKKLKKLLVNAMKTDQSWRRSAEQYLALYEEILPKKK